MEEIHRVAKPNARVILILPFFSWSWGFEDITHKHFFGYHSFDTFTNVPDAPEKFVHYSKIRFEILKREILFSHYENKGRLASKSIEILVNKFPDVYQRIFAYIFPAVELYFELRVIKRAYNPQR